MMIVANIVVFILVLGLLIFVHEMGHFIAARLSGVKVLEFGFGYPPRIFAIKRGETEYSLNWLPLGGFCKMLGEEDPSDPRSLASKSALKRLVVLGAGSFMNLLLPIVLLSIAFMVPRDVVIGDVVINDVAPNSPALEAGIETGDTIISVNGQTVQNIGDVIYEVHLSMGEETQLELEGEDGSYRVVTLLPRWNPPEGEGAMGVGLVMVDMQQVSQRDPFLQAIPKSVTTLWETFDLIRNEVISWFAKGTVPAVGGPIAIYQLTGEANEAGPSYLLQFAAFFSINLAIINLFPLPALDGGRIVFVLLEVVRRGKRVSPRTEGLIHLIGFILIIGLMLVITYFDILRALRGESLIP
ncbi:MAG: RIP metalloprotease RseP [Chloroflexota bacterium]|nr:RIP metalloprotease RseP [Chloroflexota bacterium]